MNKEIKSEDIILIILNKCVMKKMTLSVLS